MDADFQALVDPGHTVILAIDMQNDSCHPDGVYAKAGIDISWRQGAARNAAKFIEEARRYGVPVIFTQASHSSWDTSPAWLRRRKGMNYMACMEGTWGVEFYGPIPQPGDGVVVKHRYSAFIHTDLEVMLRSKQITTVVLTGGGTHVCVESTARDGYMLDFDIVAVADCCGGSIKEQEAALDRMARLCGTVVQSAELLDAWAERS